MKLSIRDFLTKHFSWLIDIFDRSMAEKQLFRRAEQAQAGNMSLARPVPVVSIIIPVYNGISFVGECIESIYNAPVGVRYEVIVIDQNSQDGTREMLQRMAASFPDFTLIENPVNVGFGRAINQGAAVARGKFLAISNSDIIVTPGWLDRLVLALRNNPQLAIVSPMTNYVGEGPQLDPEAAERVKPELASFYAQHIAERAGVKLVPDRLVFFCVLVRRQVFALLGGLSDVFGLGNYEDDDFCFRARMLGYTLGVAPGAFVFHYGSRTFKEQKIDYTALMEKNEKIFYERVVDFAEYFPPVHVSDVETSAPPSISVVVRTKDRPALLQKALASLANQFFRDFEVVVVNDGGVDISHVLDKFEPYLRFNYIACREPHGRAAALNVGATAAQGRWITYLDDDDIVYPNHLALFHSRISNDDKVKVVYSDVNKSLVYSDSKGLVFHTVARERFPSWVFNAETLLVDNCIPIMSFVHSVDCFASIGAFDEQLEIFEDWDFLIRLLKFGPFEHISRVTCEYRFRFGEDLGDSTISLREKALRTRLLLYNRYPVNHEIELQRKRAIERSQHLINAVQRIHSLQQNNLLINYFSVAKLGGFAFEKSQ